MNHNSGGTVGRAMGQCRACWHQPACLHNDVRCVQGTALKGALQNVARAGGVAGLQGGEQRGRQPFRSSTVICKDS